MKIAKIYGKCEGMEEANTPNLVIGVPSFRGYLPELGRLTKEKLPLQRQITVQRQALA